MARPVLSQDQTRQWDHSCMGREATRMSLKSVTDELPCGPKKGTVHRVARVRETPRRRKEQRWLTIY